MEKEKFIQLLSKKLSKEISEPEQAQLNHALKNNSYKKLASEIESYFNRENRQEAVHINQIWGQIVEAEKHRASYKYNFSAPKNSLFSNTLFKVAAAFVVILGMGLTGYYFLRHQPSANEVLVANHQKVFKVLADGTTVWLNKKSTLSYNASFGKERREITLKGEAFFDVAKNAAVPLIIHAGAIDVKVKGTAFNINTVQKNEGVAVALIRGAIEVTERKNLKNTVLLKPNDKLIFYGKPTLKAHFNISTLKQESILRESSWTADTLVFHKEKLVDLVLRLEKKYDLKIEIRSEKLKEKRFSGTFTNETINQALEALKLSYPLTYAITNRVVVIKD